MFRLARHELVHLVRRKQLPLLVRVSGLRASLPFRLRLLGQRFLRWEIARRRLRRIGGILIQLLFQLANALAKREVLVDETINHVLEKLNLLLELFAVRTGFVARVQAQE